MNSDDEPGRLGELPDAQLDQLLVGTSAELLGYVTASADPSQALTAIMARNATLPGSQDNLPANTQVPAALEIRLRARELTHDLFRARVLAQTYAVMLDLKPIRRDLDLADDRELAREINRAHELNRKINRAHELNRELARELARGRVSVPIYLHAASVTIALEIARDRDLADGRGLADDLGRAFNLAQELARVITRAGSVDVSGVDLSGAVIGDLDVLDGVVWTQQTTWPADIAGQVREHSELIGPGVYQVRTGDVHDHHGSARV